MLQADMICWHDKADSTAVARVLIERERCKQRAAIAPMLESHNTDTNISRGIMLMTDLPEDMAT